MVYVGDAEAGTKLGTLFKELVRLLCRQILMFRSRRREGCSRCRPY